MEEEPDEHEVGELRWLEKIWNRCCWENIREESNRGKQKVRFALVKVQLRRSIIDLL